MFDSNSAQKASHEGRRVVVRAGVGIAVVMIVGVIVYSARAGIVPGISHLSTTPGKGAANSIQAHNLCNTPSHPAGDSNASIRSGGLVRTFIVHLAPSYGNQPQPVVINYHGYDNTAQRTAQHTNMGAEADRAGFILVFPHAIDSPTSRNSRIWP